jgi:hypothetical protein
MFKKILDYFKRHKKTTSTVYTYLVGYKKTILTKEEKYAIANAAALLAQIFAEKLVVLNSVQWDWTEKDMWIHQWRKIQVEELISYLHTFERNIEEKPVEPISRQLF